MQGNNIKNKPHLHNVRTEGGLPCLYFNKSVDIVSGTISNRHATYDPVRTHKTIEDWELPKSHHDLGIHELDSCSMKTLTLIHHIKWLH